ncbi:MAG: AraC family transcriptional regulator [Clostridia bacterium]|nr:AraC family transcriptional regulator [Clostridia bacterium]
MKLEELVQLENGQLIRRIMELCRCEKRTIADVTGHRIDALIDSLSGDVDRRATVEKLLFLILKETEEELYPVVGLTKSELRAFPEEDRTAFDIADNLGVSRYWLSYCFEKETGMTVETYKRNLPVEKEGFYS